MKTLEQKLQEELKRYNAINKYSKTMILNEQEEIPAAPPAEAPPADAPAPDAPPTDAPAPAEDVKELDITDLVNMTKNLKDDVNANKQDHNNVLQKMDGVFTKLTDLESKLAEMDTLLAKIDALGNKVENIREKTPQEKLEMRSLDSGPFNETPKTFFQKKQQEMMGTNKNEYVLTKDDVENYSKDQIKNTFNIDSENYESSI